MKILENKKYKKLKSKECNYIFNKQTGFMATWGRTPEEDPDYSPYGPLILDIELSTKCKRACSFCYKSNTKNGKSMSFEVFKSIFHKINRAVTQIAFGIGSISECNDLWKIMEYCRNNSYNYVVPNITINGDDLTEEHADKLVELCGAVAVSRYDLETCYNAVKKLSGKGLNQTNIHQILCKETLNDCFQTITDWKDGKIEGLNAIVFLLMKPKGNRNKLHKLENAEDYKRLINYAFDCDAPIGFDSCGAENFLIAVKDRDNYKDLETLSEPCESSLFSGYINVDGDFFPCSFAENAKGISVLKCENFINDIWFHKDIIKFRKELLDTAKTSEVGCRSCPLYDLKLR